MADWIGINSSHYDSHCGEDGGTGDLADALDGTGYWSHSVNETHWFILDLGFSYNITKVRGRSFTPRDPIDIDIYVSADGIDWGSAVKTGISAWQDNDPFDWHEIDTTDKEGRYVRVVINSTEDAENWIGFGDIYWTGGIIDVYGSLDVTITPSALALAAAIHAPAINYDYVHSVSALALAATLQAPIATLSTIVTPSSIALLASLQAPAVNYDYIHSVSALALAAALQAPVINYDFTHSVSDLALTAVLQAPAINYDYIHSVSALALAAALQAPVINYDFTHSVSDLALTAVLQAPTVTIPKTVTPVVLALDASLQAPHIRIGYELMPPAMHAALIDPYSGGAWLWLCDIYIPGYEIIRIARNTVDVNYAGDTYTKNNFKINIEPAMGDGSIPRIILSVVQDAGYTLEDKINLTQGGYGGWIKIIRAHEDFLDKYIAELEQITYILTADSDTEYVNIHCGPPNPLIKKIPLRRYSSKTCPYALPGLFKGPECQYAGGDAVCTGKFEDCYAKGNAAHWGGEIGLDPNTSRA